MIKVVHIITRMDMGGSAQNTLLTCLELDKRKYQLVLIFGPSTESNMTELERETVEKDIELSRSRGVKIIRLPSLIRKIHPVQDLRAFFSVLKIFKNEKPDIVHTHSSKAGILGRWAAKLAGIPLVVHTPHGHVFYGHFNSLFSRMFFWIEKLTSKITHSMIALTNGERRDYIDLDITKADKVVTIHSGVKINKYFEVKTDLAAKKQSLGLHPKHRVVGTVGWLLPIKGPEHLLKAAGKIMAEIADLALVFVGKGDLREDLERRAHDMKISGRVKFLGWRDDVNDLMPLFDIFALPSLNEGMGRVLVEAMAAGKPIVASDVGGIPDLVQNGVNGLLVPPADENALAQSILELLNNPERAKKMGQTGKRLCTQFSVEAMVHKIDALYQELSISRRMLKSA